ncbi:MAG: hypothetical protein H5U40_15950 [Polyangiaceae bacterium]|nr:hypothetical protein [Polyangiaceae bacterium]
MIRSLFQGVWSLIVLGVVGYFFFFVPLGDRTTFQHLRRIVATDEAQELSHEVGEAGRRLGSELRDQLLGADAGSL